MAELYARYVPGGDPAGVPVDRRSPTERTTSRTKPSFVASDGSRTPAGTSRVRGIPAPGHREPSRRGSSPVRRAGLAPARGPRLARATTSPPDVAGREISGGRWGRFRLGSAQHSSSATTRRPIRERHGRGARMQRRRSPSRSSLAAPKRCARRSPREKKPMNDLDRDLRELFHDKAGSDRRGAGRAHRRASAWAPPPGSHGVREQLGGGRSARHRGRCGGEVGRRGPTRSLSRTTPTARRIATIHGITRHGTRGMDTDRRLARCLPAADDLSDVLVLRDRESDRSVAGRWEHVEQRRSVQPSSSCTSEPMPLPAGIPVLQLANFELPLDGTVCQVGDLRSVDLPADVASRRTSRHSRRACTTEDFLAACPGGTAVETPSRTEGRTTTYAAVSPHRTRCSPADVATVERFMNSLGGLRVPTDQPATASPGYSGRSWCRRRHHVAARGRLPVPRLRVGDRRHLGRDRRRRTRDGLHAGSARRTERRADRTDRAPRRWLWMARVGDVVTTRERASPAWRATALAPQRRSCRGPMACGPSSGSMRATQLDGSIWYAMRHPARTVAGQRRQQPRGSSGAARGHRAAVPRGRVCHRRAPEATWGTPGSSEHTATPPRPSASTAPDAGWVHRCGLRRRAPADGSTSAAARSSFVRDGRCVLRQGDGRRVGRATGRRWPLDACGRSPDGRAWIVALPGEGTGYQMSPAVIHSPSRGRRARSRNRGTSRPRG